MVARAETVAQHGWFPDPEEPGRLRMWDGRAWTSLTKYPSADDVVSGPVPSGPLPQRAAPRPGPAPTAPTAPTAPRPLPTRSALDVAARAAASPQDPKDVEPSEVTPATLLAANMASAITLGLALVCILVASTLGYPVIAVAPAVVALRAFAVHERMAPLAALAATASVIIGLVLLAK